MQNLDIQVLTNALRWAEDNDVWLCTVLSTFGSSPRPPGTMMVLLADGRFVGSLSGGCIEEDFIARIASAQFDQPAQIVRYGDGGLTPTQALPCGGRLDILIEHLAAGSSSVGYLEQMLHALRGALTLKKTLVLPDACPVLQPCGWSSSTIADYSATQVELILAAPPRIIIAGLSSVALFCANYALSLGFETIVCEHRQEVRDNFASSLHADITLITQFPASYLEQHPGHANTAIISVTHDPRIDDLTMMEAINTDAFYIGVMGSMKNSLGRLERLQRIGDFSAQDLARIHAPIGLDIASKTPAEIAIAVMADIIRCKNQRN